MTLQWCWMILRNGCTKRLSTYSTTKRRSLYFVKMLKKGWKCVQTWPKLARHHLVVAKWQGMAWIPWIAWNLLPDSYFATSASGSVGFSQASHLFLNILKNEVWRFVLQCFFFRKLYCNYAELLDSVWDLQFEIQNGGVFFRLFASSSLDYNLMGKF